MRCAGTQWLSCAFALHSPQVLEVGSAAIKSSIACSSRLLSCLSPVSKASACRCFGGKASVCKSEGLTRADMALRFTAQHRISFPGQRISRHDHSTIGAKSSGHTYICSLRQISCCPVVSNKAAEKMNSGGATAPQAAGLGVLSMFGLFGKRVIMILGGKKALLGLFSVVSFKKLLFLPAWITVLSVSAGVQRVFCQFGTWHPSASFACFA